ncbi:MAG: OmpA family protein [Acetobacteraceae bacterium]|nr:OmpA family protein [Acetobacteraceae bacterium]
MKLRSALLGATMLALPFAANAQPVTGLYVGAGAGYNWRGPSDVKNFSLRNGALGGFSVTGKQNAGGGPIALGSIGWGFGNGLRAEVEADYRYGNIPGFSSFSGSRAGTLRGGGHEQKVGGMFNVLYDFVGLTPYVQPYLGAGVGVQAIREQNWHASNSLPFTFGVGGPTFPAGGLQSELQNQFKTVFAYQAIVGAAFPIVSVPGLALTAEFRYLGTSGNRSYNATYRATTTTFASTTGAGKVQLGPTHDYAGVFGVRYNFGQAPPPPPPAAAPAPAVQPARSYLVFFDWDKATLTDRARQIIREAADNSTRVQYTRIEVNGYTDTSGTPQYNQRLSVRRAQAVAAELVRDGVPRNAISIQGFGDTHLLVPTGPGVREPQNRRVEIIIR